MSYLLVFAISAVVILNNVKCENCDKFGILLYEDMKCDPITKTRKACPIGYNCSLSRPKDGCTYKGRNYRPREEISSELTYSGCSIGCSCEDFDFIRCAELDCPESQNPPLDDGCHYEYELHKCCSIDTICNATTNAKKCSVDGAQYEIGQEFYPQNTCYRCICHENFTGTYDKSTCMRINCNVELNYSDELHKKCAPAYFNFHSNVALCCPNTFICPDGEEKIRIMNREVEQNAQEECEFGSEKLKLGEGFNKQINEYGKNRNMKCECNMPPLVSCIEV